LIYAFNGSGKTRLSREFKKQIAPHIDTEVDGADDEPELARTKFLYYSAFTEDLFYWDNDLEGGAEPKLKIQPNTFTDWLIELLKIWGKTAISLLTFSATPMIKSRQALMKHINLKSMIIVAKRWRSLYLLFLK